MRVSSALVVLVALAAASGCRDRGTPSSAPIPVRIATSGAANFSLVHLAQAKGFFAAEGLAATVELHAFGRLALGAVTEGKADLAACNETPVALAAAQGHALSVLAALASGSKATALLARKDAGIAGPRQLAGKRIGVTRGTSGDFFLDTLLLRHGVLAARVTLVDLQPAEMVTALSSGKVDAVATWMPFVLRVQQALGDRLLTFYEDDLYSETVVLVGTRRFAREQPETGRRVLRALLRAEEWMRAQPEDARRALVQHLATDPVALADTLERFRFAVRLDQSLLVLFEEEARWARRTGRAPAGAEPSFAEVLERGPLAAVRPDAVGIPP